MMHLSSSISMSVFFIAVIGGFFTPSMGFSQTSAETTVCTFNVRYDNPTDTLKWFERKDEVANAVRYFDIVALQEVLPNQFSDLSDKLTEHDSFGRGRNADGTGEACPVYWNRARYDLVKGEVKWLSTDPNQAGSTGWDADLPRLVTIVVLFDRINQETVRVLNGHWSHVGEWARRSSAAMMAGWSGHSEDGLTLVCGDFNAEPESFEISDLMTIGNLNDTYESARYRCRKEFGTFSSFFTDAIAGAKRIDYIFFRGDFEVEWACSDEHIKFGLYISDHLPYQAVFKPLN
tara:strand:- start:5459 stop:6328 length:870 start_codon:yes stop_codon:yes gene_type:complete